MVILRRTGSAEPTLGPSAAGAELTSAQRAAVADRSALVQVVGAPGSGKSRLVVEVVLDRVRRDDLDPDRCLVLAPTRLAAAALRDAVTAALGSVRGGATTQPMARTASSFAIAVLRADAALRGEPPPRLLSGPEQDVVLAELLAGHAAGEGADPGWPPMLAPALTTRGFRGELRELFMRVAELGLDPVDLGHLGVAQDRPEWVAAARVLAEYDEVTALSRPGAYDPAWLLSSLADQLTERADLRTRVLRAVELVVVDDAQELTPAALRLLAVLRDEGAQQVLLGDPDSAVQTFRGADPGGWLSAEGSRHLLTRSFRMPRAVASAAERLTGRIGLVGDGAHRRVEPVDGDGGVETHVLRSGAQEAAYVAARLRQAHLVDGLAWSDLAVIVRGAGRTAALRRALAANGVPVAAALTDAPVRDEVAVRPLLTLLELSLGVARGEVDELDPDVVVDLLTSPYGGATPVELRRLRRALRQVELAEGGGRASDTLLAEAVRFPTGLGELGPEAASARRVARMLGAGIAAARVDGASAEDILWALWSAAGVSSRWRAEALSGGASGARRDRDLDAVVALFDAAARFVDRLPAAAAGRFLDHVREQEVAGDSLVARAPDGDAVALLTPAAAAGRAWRLVVVAGAQEGVWPDLRVRGTLLGTTALVDTVRGGTTSWRAAQAAVRHDETRLFHVAVTRASERVVVTAVRSDEEQPSPYLDLLGAAPGSHSARIGSHAPGMGSQPADPGSYSAGPASAGSAPTRFTDVDRPLTLTALVAQLRRELLSPDPRRRGEAVTALARLARAGVAGADPSGWWALRAPTDTRPLAAAGVSVTVSPSKVDDFNRCGLRWLLQSRGGDGPSVGSADIGTIVHEVAAETADESADRATMRALVDAKWGRLGMRPGWVERQRRTETYAMVDRLAGYLAGLGATGWRRVAAEEALRVSLGRAVLSGRVDRVEADDEGRLRVIDLKTGSSKPTAAELAVHPQLGAYQVAVEEGAFAAYGRVSAGAGLLQLGRAATRTIAVDQQRPLADDDDPGWARRLIEETAEGMAAASFRASPGTHCGTCAVATSCPVGPDGKGARL